MVECSKCKRALDREYRSPYYYWISVVNFLEFLYNENYIEEPSYHHVLEHMHSLKYLIDDEEDYLEKKRFEEELEDEDKCRKDE